MKNFLKFLLNYSWAILCFFCIGALILLLVVGLVKFMPLWERTTANPETFETSQSQFQVGIDETAPSAVSLSPTPAPTTAATPTPIPTQNLSDSMSTPLFRGNQEQLPVVYTVEAGDSWWMVAEKFYGAGENYVQLAEFNQQPTNSWLDVGQKIIVPARDGGRLIQPEAAQFTQEQGVYIVQSGDNLWQIAEAQLGGGENWFQLYQLNQAVIGSDPGRIKPGQLLFLPEYNL